VGIRASAPSLSAGSPEKGGSPEITPSAESGGHSRSGAKLGRYGKRLSGEKAGLRRAPTAASGGIRRHVVAALCNPSSLKVDRPESGFEATSESCEMADPRLPVLSGERRENAWCGRSNAEPEVGQREGVDPLVDAEVSGGYSGCGRAEIPSIRKVLRESGRAARIWESGPESGTGARWPRSSPDFAL